MEYNFKKQFQEHREGVEAARIERNRERIAIFQLIINEAVPRYLAQRDRQGPDDVWEERYISAEEGFKLMFSLGSIDYGGYGYVSPEGEIYQSAEYTDINPLSLDEQSYDSRLAAIARSLVESADWGDEVQLREAVCKLVDKLKD